MIDRAMDAWGALHALTGRRVKVVSNVAVVVAYAFSYLALRQLSNDQWYLPAGLRFAALLIMPFRLWPALFLGEITAMAVFRYPVLGVHGLPWYMGSLFVAWPPVALIAHQLRTHTAAPRIRRAGDAVALAVAAILAGEAASLANKACTALLRPGAAPMKYSDLIVYSMGDIQGILIAAFLVALAMGSKLPPARARSFRLESICAVAIVACFTGALVAANVADTVTLVAARLCLLVPAIALALRHGWRGACIAAIASDIALFWTIPHQGKEMSDGAALVMQEVFVFLSLVLFVLGARGATNGQSVAREPADDSADQARARFNSIEQQLRERALRAEAMQASSRGNIEPVIAFLRKSGQSEAAMSLIGAANMDSVQFRDTVIDDIYPLTVERDGFAAALHSDAFLGKFGNSRCAIDLTGSSHGMSLETLLSAYRLISESLEYLRPSAPARIDLRIRFTVRKGHGHLSIAIAARDPAVTARSSVDTARLAGLRSRAAAFHGSFHSRPHRIRVILVDVPSGTPDRSRGQAKARRATATTLD